jgi:NADH-quinone oxidoreductase subunit I
VPANFNRESFVYGKKELLIPHPLKDPEGFAKARGEKKH